MKNVFEGKSKYAIITAGGSGTRMKSGVAKQFLEIAGKPILLHTVNLFRALPFYVDIILVLNKDYREYWDNYCATNGINLDCTIVNGGITRFHSVKNALEKISGGGIVAVHDGVRPFAEISMIEKLFRYKFQDKPNCAGVIPVMPITDSMRKYIRDSKGCPIGTKTIERSDYILVQTPQVFDVEILKKAYEQPYNTQFTDDASVVEKAGYMVEVTDGNRLNLKITVPEDLELAEFIHSSLEQNNL